MAADTTARYTAWLAERGIHVEGLQLHTFEREGRGLQVARAIKPGDVVVRVPLSACLSVETALQSTALAPLPEAVRRKLRTDDLLALLLWAEARAGDASPWAPHLAAQPAHVPSALYWTVDEVAKLAGSNLGVLAQRVQAQVQDDYAELVRVLRTHWPDALPTSDKDSHAFTLDQYRRALSLIWSRAMDVEVPGSSARRRLLVPFVEMANHSPTAKVVHALNADGTELVVTSNQSFAVGDQFLLFYGPIANVDLLRLYGFALRDNPFDRVDLWAPLNPEEPLFPVRRQALAAVGVQHDSPHALTVQAPLPPTVLAAVRAQVLPPEALTSLLARGHTILDETTSDVEHRVLVALRGALEGMLAGYPTNVATDVKTLAHTPAGSFAQHALFLVIAEKRILLQSLAAVNKRLSALR